MSKRERILFIITSITVASLLVLTVTNLTLGDKRNDSPKAAETLVVKDETGFSTVISRIAEQLTPTVVHIDISGTVVQQAPDFGFPFGNDPFFKYFFGPQQQEREVPIHALGSGVIISPKGYILTNNHVVEHADTIEVELYDGTKQQAKLVGTDPSTDLAVIQIEPTPNMNFATLGNSDDIRVGEWVVAIGSPRGFDWTVTAGIVSAKHRTGIGVLGPTGYEDFIQTDAAINPGNSGGPLIDLKGEVIGINALIVSASQGSEGMGFAIPSNMAKTISDSLIQYGKIVRGYLGVNIQDITSEMAQSLKMEEGKHGVIVADLIPGSPAEKGGMEQGDIILHYNGEDIVSVSQLRNLVAGTTPGETVSITVQRNRKQIDLSVKIGDLEKERKESRMSMKEKTLGITVERVTSEVAEKMGLQKIEGLIITEVSPNGRGRQAGLEKGDIIYRVGNTPVNDPKTFHSLIAQATQEGGVVLLVRNIRSGSMGYITVPLR